MLLAGRVRTWRSAPLIVQPDTPLRWQRERCRRFWRRQSRAAAPAPRPPFAPETVALIHELARAKRLWGAERIRGERGKRAIRVAKSTAQRSLRGARPPRGAGQPWASFLQNHAAEIWACDSLPVSDRLFRPPYAFFVVPLGSRRVVHVGATRHPTDARVAQQLREATPFGARPHCLIRDNDRTHGRACAGVAATGGSPRCGRPSVPRGRTPSASGSSGVCGGNASVTSSSWARATCGASSANTRGTSTTTGHSKAWRSGSLLARRMAQRARRRAACGPAPSWAASTTPMREPRDGARIDFSTRTGVVRGTG